MVLVLEKASSDNMGNSKFSEGMLAKEGTILIKFPIVEDERVVFFLYHMDIIPRAITHMPTATNRAKMSSGDRVKG